MICTDILVQLKTNLGTLVAKLCNIAPARSQVLRFGREYIFRKTRLFFYFMFKTNFSGRNKTWGPKENWGELPRNAPRDCGHVLHQGCRAGAVRSRIPNNTRSRIFCPTPNVQLDHFLHQTPKLGIPVEMVQFLLKLLLKQRFLAVHHDFHWF